MRRRLWSAVARHRFGYPWGGRGSDHVRLGPGRRSLRKDFQAQDSGRAGARLDGSNGFGVADRLTRSKAARRRRTPKFAAFTLIELLTVIAIIGVLATLLLTVLASAKKMGRQARCVSNLRQLGLATHMYLDDFEDRPRDIAAYPKADYLPDPKVMICPADTLGDWGNRVNFSLHTPPFSSALVDASDVLDPTSPLPERADPPFSYLHPLGWGDDAWAFLKSLDSEAGLAACQLHGIGRQNEEAPSLHDFEGLVLRMRRDGAVVRRHVFWNRPGDEFDSDARMSSAPVADLAPGFAPEAIAPPSLGVNYPWQLFMDGDAP